MVSGFGFRVESDPVATSVFSEPTLYREGKMNRRTAIRRLATFFLTTTSLAHAQQAGKIFRIGYLDSSTAAGSAVLVKTLLQELSKLGWIEGKNLTIEYRFAENKGRERTAELTAELVRLKVDLIVAPGAPPALAAKSATTTIPIVMASAADPVGTGLVEIGRAHV